MNDDAVGRQQSPHQVLEELIASYLRAVESGMPVDRVELLAQYPGLAEHLRAFFAARGESAPPASGDSSATSPPPDIRDAATIAPTPRAEAPTRNEALETNADPYRTVPSDGSIPSGGSRGNKAHSIPGYEILGELGRGGMGVVYKARHLRLNRLVALKMILSGEHAGEHELRRFRTEAEAIAKLHHPNIVQIYEIGEHDGRPYFALEFVEGGSLDQKLASGAHPVLDAVELVELLSRAVHAVHRCGLVHRDLKPANVLLTSTGTPKIADFGLVKRLGAETRLTASGAVMGTPSYMAPEQAGGECNSVGPMADVYALGAILYEMLAGRPPFQAATAVDTMLRVVSDDASPPSRWKAHLPSALDTICLKCLEKAPERRYDSAEALAEDLRRYRQNQMIRAQPTTMVEWWVKWVKRRPAIAALTGLVALLILLAIPVLYGLWEDAESKAAVAKAALAREQASANALSVYSPDGRYLAIADGQSAVSLRDGLSGKEIAQLKGKGRSITFSPDSQRIALVVEEGFESTVKFWQTSDGAEQATLAKQFGNRCARFSPDGGQLFVAAGSTISVWDVKRGEKLFALEGHQDDVLHLAVHDSQLVSYSKGEVILWDVVAKKERHRFPLPNTRSDE